MLTIKRYSHIVLSMAIATTSIHAFAADGDGRMMNVGAAVGAGVVVATSPGRYEYVDLSAVAMKGIDFSIMVQKQDQELFEKTVADAQTEYTNLYNNFYLPLYNIHVSSVVDVNNPKPADVAELARLMEAFKIQRDLFLQKIGAVAVVQDVWKSMSARNDKDMTDADRAQRDLIYSKGSLNLKALTDAYRAQIGGIESNTRALTYVYFNGQMNVSTVAGAGLDEPTVQASAAVLKMNLESLQRTTDAILEVKRKGTTFEQLADAFSTELKDYVNDTTNSKHWYWFNDLQKTDQDAWIASLQTKARLLKYVRAVYCAPIGVPAIVVPELKSFDLNYLVRGAKGIRMPKATMFDENEIRTTLVKFDEKFVSLQSQNGEYNDQGGVMGVLNRINSTVTWHNEVGAYMNIMKILREGMIDETDILADSVVGCEKVRSRYREMYASTGGFQDKIFDQTKRNYFEGLANATTAEYVAAKTFGSEVMTQLSIKKKLLKELDKTPSVFTDDAGDL
jgi:hypothetical protein